MLADGVLLTGFGGPDCADAVRGFMRNLTGREPDEAVVARVRARYERIGWCSPMGAVAQSLAVAVKEHLAAAGRDLPVAVGMRYWSPSIEEAVLALVRSGARCIAHLSLSAFEASVTHASYREAIVRAIAPYAAVRVCEGPLLSSLSVFSELHSEALQRSLEAAGDARVVVLFTAHSLPVRRASVEEGYVAGLRAVSAAVATGAGLRDGSDCRFGERVVWGDADGERPWLLCYQSRSARTSEWLEPDIGGVIDALPGERFDAVVVSPVGFALDHMETLYDLDIEARERAESRGLSFYRAAVPNADPRLAEGIAQAVLDLRCDEG